MQNKSLGDRLSWGDTVFLNLEREGMPLNVASVCLFEGEIPFSAFSQFVESKLPLLPRYLKRVVSPPFNIGLPSWEYDPTFDIKNHVHEVKLKTGSENELKALAGKIFSKVMDRQHPLWDFTLVRGIQGSRTGLIPRLHHCLADGIAGVELMNLILDSSPESPRLPKRKIPLEVPPPRDPLAALVGGMVDSYSDFVKRMLSAMADVLTMAERLAMNGGDLAGDELSRLLPEITAFTQRLRFNVLYCGPQKFAWGEVSLEEVKAIRRRFGASVNDVILALVTATIRRYLEMHGDRVKGRLFRMMVPVNLRGSESPGALGNRISLVPVTIPLDIRNPGKLLVAVHKRTEFLKRVHAPELVSLAGGLIGMFPTALQATIGPMASRLPVTPFNLVCTNVPGPQNPLYVLGHKMLRWYPYVPVGGEMAMNCAILSYDGNLYFGFSGDTHAVPDLRRLEGLLQLSFEELRDAAGLEPPRGKTRAIPRKKAAAAAASPISVPLSQASSKAAEKQTSTTEVQKILTQMVA